MSHLPRSCLLVLVGLAAGACRSAAPKVQAAQAAVLRLDAGAEVRFAAVGDTGKGNPQQRQVGEAMAQVCAAQGCDFVALLGDNFYPSGVSSTTDPQWETAFVQPYAHVQAPFFAVLGNHDYGGNGSGNELEKAQHEVAYSQVNPKWHLPATHYRFSAGPVDFFVADTNRSLYALDAQVRADFERWWGESTAPWRVVLGHHPLRSNGRHGNAGSYDGVTFVPLANGASVRSFLEDEVCGRADLYLCGHEHVMEWLEPTCGRAGSGRRTELVISGGGASPTTFPEALTNADRFRAEGLGFLYVVIRGDTLTGTFYDAEGQARFTRTFTRTGP
jgi:tartrate-resistant acid phosphatase type 5